MLCLMSKAPKLKLIGKTNWLVSTTIWGKGSRPRLPQRHEARHPKPSLHGDVQALVALFDSEVPPKLSIRCSKCLGIIYGFTDASGKGRGASFGRDLKSSRGNRFRIGVWTAVEQEESSNWKELATIVGSLEAEAESGALQGTEVLMLTDNQVTESALWRGNSSSPKLLDLVIRFK